LTATEATSQLLIDAKVALTGQHHKVEDRTRIIDAPA
jgi:hypothetical protein